MKELYLEIFYNYDSSNIYDGDADNEDFEAHVTIELPPEEIATIRDLAYMCKTMDLAELKTWDYSPNWGSLIDGNAPLRWDVGMREIDRNCVRWTCYIKHTDIKLRTDRVRIKDLCGET